MNFSYNKYHELETPDTYLAYPNKKIICKLPVTDRQTELCFVSASSYSFSLNKYRNGEKFKYYDEITIGRYVEFKNVAWFRITKVDTEGDGENETMTVTCSSIESETGQTYVTALGSLGVDEDDQGGLDIYCLYSETDQAHSIMHKFFEKNPSWSMGYFDPAIKNEYRIVSEDSVTSYDLLTSTAMELWECVFQFDTYTKTVSVYKLENIGKTTSIYLSYRNLIKKLDVSYDEADVKTVFYVVGGTDATNTTLSIADVNPSGNGYISNYNYFLKDMSKELREKYQEYLKKMVENLEPYQTAMAEMQTLYDTLANLYNAHPDTEDSTDWTKYGSVELEGRIATFKNLMSIYKDDSSGKTYQEAYTNFTNASAELVKRQKEIEDINSKIEAAQKKAQSYVVNIIDFLGADLYKELTLFNREDTFTDDSFVTTDKMTEADTFKMKKALLEHAQNELAKVCFPQFSMTVDSINFPKIFRYKKYTDQLDLGNIITINIEDGYNIEARLLKISINWDNPSDFSLTFSSKTSLEDGVFEFQDVKNNVEKLGNSLNISSSAWNNASQSSATILTDMSSFLNASLRAVQNSKDNEVNMDGTGITIRKSNGDGTYDPNQLWMTRGNIIMTDDGWKSVKIAIGQVEIDGIKHFGIAASEIYGTAFVGQNMIIQNTNNTLTIDKNGLVAKATNGYSLTINPDDPNAIFTIKKDSNTILGVDATNNKFVFKGTLESTDGHLGNWTINDNGLFSSNVGLSSKGDVRIWAGNDSASNAIFKVESNGKLTCSNADIAGAVNATSGKIGGWIIDGNILRGTSGSSFIVGGEISIGDDFFSANDSEVQLGDFVVYSGNRGQFSSSNSNVGMMSKANNNQFWLWAGASSEPYPFGVRGDGKTYIRRVANSEYWLNYSLDQILDYIWIDGTYGLKALYDWTHNGGWNPCKQDDECDECTNGDGCDSSCDTCDELCDNCDNCNDISCDECNYVG